MMLKFWSFVGLIFAAFCIQAQCPISVQLVATPDATITPVCKGTPIQIEANSSFGVVNPNYIWVINGDTINSVDTIINIAANDQNIQVYLATNTGCSQDTVSNTIQIQTIIITTDVAIIDLTCNKTQADVFVIASGGSSPYTFDLEGVGINNTGSFTDVQQGSYNLYISDSNGCTDTSQVEIVPFECPPPTPIKAFTPNDDGILDRWFIQEINKYPDNEVFIYDRWGQRVYHKEGYTNLDAWDAKYVGLDMPVSTYYYIIKYKSNNKEHVLNGAVSIFR